MLKNIKLNVKQNGVTESIGFTNIYKTYFTGKTISLFLDDANYFASITNDLTDADLTKLRIKVKDKVYGFCKTPKTGDKKIIVLTNKNHQLYQIYDNHDDITVIPDILITDDVTDGNGMFGLFYNLREVPYLDTSHMTNLSVMFRDCLELESIPWTIDMKSCIDRESYYEKMFDGCDKLTGVKLKNVPPSFDPATAGLKEGQYTILSRRT